MESIVTEPCPLTIDVATGVRREVKRVRCFPGGCWLGDNVLKEKTAAVAYY